MRILFIGDLFASAGRDLVRRMLPPLRDRFAPDLVIANVENAAGGFGITREMGEAILGAGVDVMTLGNHAWDRKESLPYLDAEPRIVRPANFSAGVPGRGSLVARTPDGTPVAVINLIGRVYLAPADDPFAAALTRESTRSADRRASSSSISTPKRRPRRRRWPGTWTGGSARSSAPTPTSRRPTPASSPAARQPSPTSE